MKNNRVKDFTRETLTLKVSFSVWDGKLASDRVAQIAADSEHADKARIEGKVVALPRKMQKDIFAAKGLIEKLWKASSRPWQDGGVRLCWAAEYEQLRAQLEEARRGFRDAVQNSIAKNYAELRAGAEKDLNGLIGDRFPDKSALMAKYDVRFYVDTIASTEDIRFSGLNETEVAAIVAERQRGMQEIIDAGNSEMVRDIQRAASALAETLADPDKGFNGCPELGFPIVENLRSMLDRCDKFNITQDEKLAALIARVRKQVEAIKLDTVKDDKAERKAMAVKAKSLVDELASF